MKERDFLFHDGKAGSAITVRLTPRASRNEITEILDDGTVKIRLERGQRSENINRLLLDFLAEVLEISQSQLEVIGGQEGNDKLITILDLDKTAVQDRILRNLT